MNRTPLAWKNLTHDRWRLVAAVVGVGFAALLIFMELGFLNALLESTVQIVRRMNGELVIVSSARYALPANERFDIRRLQQAEAVPGVQAVYPVYIETVAGVLRAPNSRAQPIRVLAFREDEPVFNREPILSFAPELARPYAALADVASRAKFGLPSRKDQLAKFPALLSGRRVQLVGQFRLGVDFATDGNLLMTASNFALFFPHRAAYANPLSVVDLAMVKVQRGANVEQVKESLRAVLPEDVNVFTRDQLIDREKIFWSTNAPVGYIFLVGVYMGFVVGVIICYQIIYTDIANHMREFATLKAMGYSNWYFCTLVLWQAFYLSIMGFVPGCALSYVCYRSLARVTGLTMEMTLTLAATVFAVTLLMCVVSGLLALRKLMAMDPAELF
jgi:putative ABC transport system permease protein